MISFLLSEMKLLLVIQKELGGNDELYLIFNLSVICYFLKFSFTVFIELAGNIE